MNLLESVFSSNHRGLSPLQGQVDERVGNFVREATAWRSLSAMVAAGLAYRMAKTGVLGLSVGASTLSVAAGLTAEVSTFEGAHRMLASVLAGSHGHVPRFPNLWRWHGPGGLQQGLLHSFLSFGSLKFTGHLARSENILVRHLFQDSAMVLGHQASGALGISPVPKGPLAEQFLHAAAANLQMEAGMAVGRGLSPRLHSFEHGLDLFATRERILLFFPTLNPGDRVSAPALAGQGTKPWEVSVWRMADGKESQGEAENKTEKWDDITPANTTSNDLAKRELVRRSNEKILRADLDEIRSKGVYYVASRLSVGTGFSGLALGPGKMPIHGAVDPQTGQIIGVGKFQSLPEDIVERAVEVVFVAQIVPENFNGDYKNLGDFKPHISQLHFFETKQVSPPPKRISPEAKETLLGLKGVPFRQLTTSSPAPERSPSTLEPLVLDPLSGEESTPFPLNLRDRTLLEKASGQKLGNSLSYLEWSRMNLSMERSAFPKTHPEQLGNLTEDLIGLYIRITQHFREGK